MRTRHFQLIGVLLLMGLVAACPLDPSGGADGGTDDDSGNRDVGDTIGNSIEGGGVGGSQGRSGSGGSVGGAGGIAGSNGIGGGVGSGGTGVGGQSGSGSGGIAGGTGRDAGSGGMAGSGSGGSGGGGSGGSTGTGGTGPDQTKAAQWLGRWSGTAGYEVTTFDFATMTWVVSKKSIEVQLRIDTFDFDAFTGRATVSGRAAVGYCLLSAELAGTIFWGDDLSQVKSPMVSWEAAGDSDQGKLVVIEISGANALGLITGTLSFEASDDTRKPCNTKDLPVVLRRQP